MIATMPPWQLSQDELNNYAAMVRAHTPPLAANGQMAEGNANPAPQADTVSDEDKDTFALANQYAELWNSFVDVGMPPSDHEIEDADADLEDSPWLLQQGDDGKWVVTQMPQEDGAEQEAMQYSRDAGLRARIVDAAAETDRKASEAQRKAGNYKKGRVSLHGLTFVIENPKGSIRRGKDWKVVMKHHYGYLLKHESEADGDHVDVFLGPNPESEIIFVVDQKKLNGTFDEAKVMMGFVTEKEAKAAYMSNYSEGWKGFQNITPLTIDAFKEWLEHGDTGRAIAKQKIVLQHSRQARAMLFVREYERIVQGLDEVWQYAAQRAPEKGVTINGKFFRGGQFIPTDALKSLKAQAASGDAKAQEDLGRVESNTAAQEATRQKNTEARSKRDVSKLKGKLEGHAGGEADQAAQKKATNSFRALKRIHGDLVQHRLDELADQTQARIEKVDRDLERTAAKKGDGTVNAAYEKLQGKRAELQAQMSHLGRVHKLAEGGAGEKIGTKTESEKPTKVPKVGGQTKKPEGQEAKAEPTNTPQEAKVGAANTPQEDKILKAMHDIDANSKHGAVVLTRDLWRKIGSQFPSKEAFDRAIIQLAENEKIVPHRHDQISFLKPEEVNELVYDPERNQHYHGVAHRMTGDEFEEPQESVAGEREPESHTKSTEGEAQSRGDVAATATGAALEPSATPASQETANTGPVSQQPAPEQTQGESGETATPLTPQDDKILKTIEGIDQNFNNGSTVLTRDIRRKLKDQFPTKEAFDRAIVKLAEDDKLILHRVDQTSFMTPQEKNDLIYDPERNQYYIAVAKRLTGDEYNEPQADTGESGNATTPLTPQEAALPQNEPPQTEAATTPADNLGGVTSGTPQMTQGPAEGPTAPPAETYEPRGAQGGQLTDAGETLEQEETPVASGSEAGEEHPVEIPMTGSSGETQPQKNAERQPLTTNEIAKHPMLGEFELGNIFDTSHLMGGDADELSQEDMARKTADLRQLQKEGYLQSLDPSNPQDYQQIEAMLMQDYDSGLLGPESMKTVKRQGQRVMVPRIDPGGTYFVRTGKALPEVNQTEEKQPSSAQGQSGTTLQQNIQPAPQPVAPATPKTQQPQQTPAAKPNTPPAVKPNTPPQNNKPQQPPETPKQTTAAKSPQTSATVKTTKSANAVNQLAEASKKLDSAEMLRAQARKSKNFERAAYWTGEIQRLRGVLGLSATEKDEEYNPREHTRDYKNLKTPEHEFVSDIAAGANPSEPPRIFHDIAQETGTNPEQLVKNFAPTAEEAEQRRTPKERLTNPNYLSSEVNKIVNEDKEEQDFKNSERSNQRGRKPRSNIARAAAALSMMNSHLDNGGEELNEVDPEDPQHRTKRQKIETLRNEIEGGILNRDTKRLKRLGYMRQLAGILFG